MDTVIITGANGEPALSVARRLCGLGIRVCALAGTIPETGLSADEFVPVPCDPTSPRAVAEAVEEILRRERHVVGVILAGQYLSEERFEAVSTEEIEAALNAQVVAPLCAVRLALPSLIAARGHVVVVSPGTGAFAGRALNAVADAATRSFAGTLFAELRDTGVKTCHILLQSNEGAPDPAARFTTAPQSRIHADIVADAVETVFRLRENNALTQMILRPQATRETPHIPVSAEPKIRALQVVQLPPPKNFPPEEEPIPTPAYHRPDYAPKKTDASAAAAEEGDEDARLPDDYVDPELRYLVKNTPPEQGAREGKNRRKRRNRKNRNRDGAIRVNAPRLGDGQQDAPREQSAVPAQPAETPPEPRERAEDAPAAAASDVSAPVPATSAEPVPAAEAGKRPRKKTRRAAADGKPNAAKKPRAPRKKLSPPPPADDVPAA